VTSRFKQVIAVLATSFFSLGCTFIPDQYEVPHSFSVRVSNGHGPVAGLKLRVTKFRTEEFSKLKMEQPEVTRVGQFVELIAEATTNDQGEARFNLSGLGRFTLQPDHPVSGFASVDVFVTGRPAPDTVELVWPISTTVETEIDLGWPTSAILQTTQVRGRISYTLMPGRISPTKQEILSLRKFISFEEVAMTTTGEDGSFQFDVVPTGLYFLQMEGKASDTRTGGSPEGHGAIALYVGPESTRDSLLIVADVTTCGLMYDLEENKAKAAPQSCFKGGVLVPCDN
jgi:hypothetical protein